MDAIRRIPPAHEQAMWPDTLPASIVVPADFTWHVPGDLDLSGTDLTVLGTVQLPPVPFVSVDAATETSAGVVELATQAEVDAGTDALRAVTPATLAGWTGGGGGGVLFNEATLTPGPDSGYSPRNVTVALTLDGAPVTQRVAFWVFVTESGFFEAPSDNLRVSGLSIYPADAFSHPVQMLLSDSDGSVTLSVSRVAGIAGNVQVAVVLPTGGLIYSEAFNLGGVEPP